MKSCVAVLLCLVFVVSTMTGCASRTKIGFGPLGAAAEIQVFDSLQTPDFDFSINRVGFTLGYVKLLAESKIGLVCPEVIGVQSSTGNTDRVFRNVPAL